MIAVGANLAFLLGSAVVITVCSLWAVALLDIQSQMRREGAYSHKTLVFVAIAISVLAVCLITMAHTFFIGSSDPLRLWSDWGTRLGS
jgi:hypothetical protein